MAKESIKKILKADVDLIVTTINILDEEVKKRIEEVKERQNNIIRLKYVDVDRLKTTVFQL